MNTTAQQLLLADGGYSLVAVPPIENSQDTAGFAMRLVVVLVSFGLCAFYAVQYIRGHCLLYVVYVQVS